MRIDQQEQAIHPSLDYWDLDDDRRVQRYYIGLCLLMAALQDALMGRVEQRFQNLNWSATVSYYSLVHSGRLIAFVAVGDYPTQHSILSTLLSNRNRPVRLNWLSTHRNLAHAQDAEVPKASFDQIVAMLDAQALEGARDRLEHFGLILSASAELRTDSNYEALLVAHEFAHSLVSLSFKHLSEAIALAAEEGLLLAIDVFNSMRGSVPASVAPALESLTATFLYNRVRPALESKIRNSSEAARLLRMAEERLHLNTYARQDPLLEERLDMLFFSGKTRLMDRFRQRIIALEKLTSTYHEEHWGLWGQMPEIYPQYHEDES